MEKIINYNHPYFRNMPQPTTKSNCCGAEMKVITDTDLGRAGTSYYECSNCGKPCDPQPTTNNEEGWEERLEAGFYKEFGHFNAPCNLGDTPKSETDDWEILYYFKQFISELRKKDELELIKMFEGDYFETNNKEIGQLIQDYYKNTIKNPSKIRLGITYKNMETDTTSVRELTYGEKAVGLTFNPGGNETVNKVKKLYAEIIDLMNDLPIDVSPSEKARLAKIAITEAQTAQMWAVKAITWE